MVSENLAGDLRIITVSEKFNLNKSTRQHIFKEQQKETYREYVERMRMDNALHLLKEGKWLKEVSLATEGITTGSLFIRPSKKDSSPNYLTGLSWNTLPPTWIWISESSLGQGK